MTPYPLTFHPVLKRTIWGGRRLGDVLGKPIGSESDYAESWEIVDHGDDQSIVVGGELAGKTLAEVIASHGKWLLGEEFSGEVTSNKQSSAGRFPLLLKYLDCNRVLSVQVHPDDAFGATLSPPDLGKTEAWYVVSSDPGSLIYAGLAEGVDRSSLAQAIEAGQTEQVLHSFHPEVGDVVFIPAGTVHALGAGLVIAEIQQSSDTTFRLFDWNRVDASGKSRPLHIESSLSVTDYQSGPVNARRLDPEQAGWQSVVDCDKFVLRVLKSGQAPVGGDGKFHIVTVPEGTASWTFGDQSANLSAGQTLLIPAAMESGTIAVGPGGTVLESHLPD